LQIGNNAASTVYAAERIDRIHFDQDGKNCGIEARLGLRIIALYETTGERAIIITMHSYC